MKPGNDHIIQSVATDQGNRAESSGPMKKRSKNANKPLTAFHVMAKPMGPICNLDCRYCFYLEKENLYGKTQDFAMPDVVLESYISQFITSQDAPAISFAWQGGEPTLLGVDF